MKLKLGTVCFFQQFFLLLLLHKLYSFRLLFAIISKNYYGFFLCLFLVLVFFLLLVGIRWVKVLSLLLVKGELVLSGFCSTVSEKNYKNIKQLSFTLIAGRKTWITHSFTVRKSTKHSFCFFLFGFKSWKNLMKKRFFIEKEKWSSFYLLLVGVGNAQQLKSHSVSPFRNFSLCSLVE